MSLAVYPEGRAGRDRWILERRGARNVVDPAKPHAFFVEDECSKTGEQVSVATILLTNRECPWRCLMCDLWKNTLPGTAPSGAISAQIDYALQRLQPARQIKLYNSGSFFDPNAAPPGEYPAIARQLSCFDRVIVESHPALVGARCFRFSDLIDGELEVAMGLETAHPPTLQLLNKGMTLDQFASGAGKLRGHSIDLRVFILVKPPFMREDEALLWGKRSIDFAFDCGATAVSLIPARGGNGAMEELAANGDFGPPRWATLEAVLEYGLSLDRGRVFADLWNTNPSQLCQACGARRLARLDAMNKNQIRIDAVHCDLCKGPC